VSEQTGHRLKYFSVAGILVTIAVCCFAYQRPCPNNVRDKFDMAHRGMQKNQVLFLLGQPDMIYGVKGRRLSCIKESDETYISFFWEYFDKQDDSLKEKKGRQNTMAQEVPEPDEDAYVLFFDGNDKVLFGMAPRKTSP
jgi:hypothetical protein